MTYSPVTLESLLSHQTWALRVARRLVRQEDEAEDLVQRTWIAALRSPPQSEVGAKAWIRKVILNLARERHRRNQARVRHETARPSAEEGVAPGDAFESASRAEIHRLLSERLMQLAEPYRTVVLQRFFEDLTSVEIAQRMGIPPGTVRWRLKIGLDQLRDELDRRSRGDRTRWVSALLAFSLPRGSLPRGSRGAQPARETTRTTPIVPAATLAWTVLGAAGLLGLSFLRGPLELGRSDAGVAAGAPVLASDPPPSGGPDVDRPAADRRAPAVVGATPEPAGRRIPDAPRGLALLVLSPEGAPVAGAAIQVARADGYELRARSDDQGRAWLEPGPGDVGALGLEVTRGRLSVRAIAAGRAASELVHVAPPFTPEHEVRLNVGGPERVLRGRVRTAEGTPVPGAEVAWFVQRSKLQLRPEGDFSSTTYLTVRSGPDGAFELTNLSDRGEVVACFAPGFALYSRSCDTLDERSFEIVLERGATLVGTIRQPGGSPAAGVPVSLESICKTEEWATGLPGYDARRQGFFERTRTDEQGRFRIEGVCAGGRQRAVWALDEERGLCATTSLRLEDGAELVWDAELAELPRLDLRFVDEHRRPLAGLLANVRRQIQEGWWARRLHTDGEGRIRILDCPAGPVFLDLLPALGEGASLGWRPLYPSQEEQTIVIDSRRQVTLQGRLLDPSGAPESRGELIAMSLDTSLKTTLARNPDGRFRERLPPGTYILLLQFEQSLGKLTQVRCFGGSEHDLGDLTTPPLGKLLLEALPDSLSSYSVSRVADEGEPTGSLLVGRGWIRESASLSMFPGRYGVIVFPRQGPTHKYLVRVLPDQVTRIETWRRP